MNHVLRLIVTAWAWWQRFKISAMQKFFERIIVEVSKKRKVPKAQIVSEAKVISNEVALGNWGVALAKFRAFVSDNWVMVLTVLWGCFTVSDLIAVSSVEKEMSKDGVELEEIPVLIANYVSDDGSPLHKVTSSTDVNVIKSDYESKLAEFEDYIEEHGVNEAIVRYQNDAHIGPVLNDTLRHMGKTAPQTALQCSSLVQMSLKIKQRQALVQRYADLLGVSKEVAREFYSLQKSLTEEDFAL